MRWGKHRFERREQKPKDRTTPHLWFAWYPVYLRTGEYVWLERIYRYELYPHNGWRYGKTKADVRK